MAYEYSDPRSEERGALPDVEVFYWIPPWPREPGFYYALGSPGCFWGSKRIGPFPTYQEALDDARSHGDCHEDYDPKVDR